MVLISKKYIDKMNVFFNLIIQLKSQQLIITKDSKFSEKLSATEMLASNLIY